MVFIVYVCCVEEVGGDYKLYAVFLRKFFFEEINNYLIILKI